MKEFTGDNEVLEREMAEMERVVLGVMGDVIDNHLLLGERGKMKEAINRFGEQAMVADLAAEEKIKEGLVDYLVRSGKKVFYRGEELGEGVMGEGEAFTLIMDGLDGSANYAKKTEWPYGPMVSLAKGANPRYCDFSMVSIALPEENWVVIGVLI